MGPDRTTPDRTTPPPHPPTPSPDLRGGVGACVGGDMRAPGSGVHRGTLGTQFGSNGGVPLVSRRHTERLHYPRGIHEEDRMGNTKHK